MILSFTEQEDKIAVEWITKRVESFSALPAQEARCAYTHRRTPFIVFANGLVKCEGEHPVDVDLDVFELAERTVAAIRKHRDEIAGRALLVWRRLPEVSRNNGEITVSCRLVFEPDLWA